MGGGIPIGVGGGGLALLRRDRASSLLTGNVPGGGGGSGGGPLDRSRRRRPTGDELRSTIPTRRSRTSPSASSTTSTRTWAQIFQQAGRDYQPARLVLFTQATDRPAAAPRLRSVRTTVRPTRPSTSTSRSSDELRDRFGASGDFAHAYVIAHEVGHHVQNELGIMDRVENREDGIRLELQADCLAGVWGYTAEKRGLLDPGDTREALDAAAAVGDDRIQQQTQGRVTPENWTHGSSEQRMKWFTRGMNKGDPAACDTFSGEI